MIYLKYKYLSKAKQTNLLIELTMNKDKFSCKL